MSKTIIDNQSSFSDTHAMEFVVAVLDQYTPDYKQKCVVSTGFTFFPTHIIVVRTGSKHYDTYTVTDGDENSQKGLSTPAIPKPAWY